MIEQISKDIYRVTKEVTEDIDIAKLKTELAFRKTANEEVKAIIDWKSTLPEDKKKYVIDVPMLDEKEIENQIKELSVSNIQRI